MPEAVSRMKLNATRKIGAEVILKGQVGDDALAHSIELARKRQISFLHPHKTPPFLEGNATIAHEIFEELPDVKRIFIPIGGGGLASGICRYVRKRGLPVKLVGVEAEQAPAFWLSFRQGRPVRLERMETIADALTLLEPDPEVFAELHQNLDHVATVSEDDMIRMMRLLLDEYRVIAEPGGAASLAAMLREDSGEPAAAIISGGNVSLEEFQELTSRVAS
jgi:threonine dehydratase